MKKIITIIFLAATALAVYGAEMPSSEKSSGDFFLLYRAPDLSTATVTHSLLGKFPCVKSATSTRCHLPHMSNHLSYWNYYATTTSGQAVYWPNLQVLYNNLIPFVSTTTYRIGTTTFKGYAGLGKVVKVFSPSGVQLCSVTVTRSLTWRCDLVLTESPGWNIYKVTDHMSGASRYALVPLYITRSAPNPPRVIVNSTGTNASGTVVYSTSTAILNAASPNLSLVTDQGNTLQIFNGSSSIPFISTTTSGTTTLNLNLPDGEYDLTIVIRDQSGASATATIHIVIDTAAPTAPFINGLQNSNSSTTPGFAVPSENILSSSTPSFIGSGESGSIMTLYTNGSSLLCSTLVTQSGDWSCSSAIALADGEYELVFTLTDSNGNASAQVKRRVRVQAFRPSLLVTWGSSATSSPNSTSTFYQSPSGTTSIPFALFTLNATGTVLPGYDLATIIYHKDIRASLINNPITELTTLGWTYTINPSSLAFTNANGENGVMTGDYKILFIQYPAGTTLPCTDQDNNSLPLFLDPGFGDTDSCELHSGLLGTSEFEIIDNP